ncbi:hypothetical protein JR338_10510 [Chloroflexota bacterium]|nr:hypothetical protein JR338_10510 [Chloroflexota bacterium]
MSDQTLVNRANALLQSDQLRPKAKAFLLLKLCQVHTLLASEHADVYWQQLQPLQKHLGNEDQALLQELRSSVEEEEDPTKGFAGEKIAEIKAKLAEPGLTEAALREFLDAMAKTVEKRFWPGGKQAVWVYLVQVWKTIDRSQALGLTSKLSRPKRQLQVRQMNQESPLSVEEWQRLAEENSQKEAIRIIAAILDDPKVKLTVPDEYIVPVVSSLSLNILDTSKLGSTLDQINKFLVMAFTEDTVSQIFDALGGAASTFANSTALNNQWPEKFRAVLNLVILGVKLGVITNDNVSSFVQNLPKYMVDFGYVTCYALISDGEDLQSNMAEAMKVVSKAEQAEAWFLVIATQRGYGGQAYVLAKDSPRKQQLVPRICRAWLSNYPEAAAKGIDPEDVKDDFVAQTLMKTDKKERVAFLREITQEGSQSLPGGMWVSEAQVEEKKGFWDSLFSSGATLDEIIEEYLKRNPLYVSYRPITPVDQQFKEFLRFNGHGEYNYRELDPITLESLILWAEDHPQEVEQQLALMWRSIEPDNNILKVNFLRNAIFERCTTVFAADPNSFNTGFVKWLKEKLVDSSLIWQAGKTQYTVHYPETALATMCLRGAIATQNLSPSRRDKLVEIALTQHPSVDNLGELGAQLYNTGKTLLDIEIPWKTKSEIADGWQMGIVKNAIPEILQEVAQSKVSGE